MEDKKRLGINVKEILNLAVRVEKFNDKEILMLKTLWNEHKDLFIKLAEHTATDAVVEMLKTSAIENMAMERFRIQGILDFMDEFERFESAEVTENESGVE